MTEPSDHVVRIERTFAASAEEVFDAAGACGQSPALRAAAYSSSVTC